MGVAIHILDRRTVRLDVGGTPQTVGTLRHLSKVTEVDSQRAAEIAGVTLTPSPPAVVLAESVRLPLVSVSGTLAAAHLVIGWDEGRGSVPDLGWDYLPTLGYAVRDEKRGALVLHELRDGALHVIDAERARALGLLAGEALVQRGQPVISRCHSIRPYIPGFAEADCLLADGRRERLLLRVTGYTLPEPAWLVGRRPMDVERYSDGRHASGAGADGAPSIW